MSDEFVMLMVVFAVSATVNLGLAISWYRTNKRLKQVESRPMAVAQIDELAARVDATLDTVSARLDEFASAQDFMNRVLVERLDKLNRPALQKGAPPSEPS
jgi:biopolymer transport protein ExbB/TolQ